jgi:hypothetical protein
MDLPSLYAMGAFIQALQQNPGIEQELQSLGIRAHVLWFVKTFHEQLKGHLYRK